MTKKKSSTAKKVGRAGGKTRRTEGKCEGDSSPEHKDHVRTRVVEANTVPGRTSRRPTSFVLLSDLHAHAWSSFAKGDGRDNTRLRRSLDVLDASLAKARELGVVWVFGGDIVHTAGYTLNVVLSELVEVLARYPDVVKLAVWGNHDARGVGGKITLEQTVLSTLARAVDQFFVLDPSVLSLYKDPKTGLTFSGAGYQPKPELLTYGQEADVGVYHQTVRGTKTPNGFELTEGICSSELVKRHRFTAVGHVHHWQYHPDHHAVILIPGSPEHHTFGDTGEHGWWIVSLEDPRAPTMIPGGSPEFRTVATPKDVKNDGNFYRVQSVPPGTSVPKDVQVIAPVPTAIQTRDVLKGARGEQAINAWLGAEPPSNVSDVEPYAAAGRFLLQAHEVGNLRPMRLRRVTLKNFCSYADATLDVQPGTWLVIGRGRDFPSNGAGKSTLFEAVFWSLFGKTTKGLSGDEVIRWGADTCEVRLEFDDGGEPFTVSRTRGTGSRVLAGGQNWAIEGKSVTEVSEKLAKFLGLTPELYQALGYFSQEKLLLFASATDGERKDMLGDLIGLSAYQEASSNAQRQCAELDVQEQRLAALQDATKQQYESEEKRLADLQVKSAAWEQDRARREAEARGAVTQFDKDLPSIRDQMLASARSQLNGSIDERLQKTRQTLAIVDSKLAEPRDAIRTPEELAEAQRNHSEQLSQLKAIRARVAEKEGRLAVLQQRMEKQREALGAGKCPSCGQDVSEEHQAKCLAPIQDDIATLLAEIDELIAEQGPVRERAVFLQLEVNEITAGVNAGNVVRSLENEAKTARAVLANLEQEAKEIEASAVWHVDKSIREHREGLERKVTAILSERSPYAGEEAGTVQRRQEAAVAMNKHLAERGRIQEQMAIMDYWRHGFSKQGIQSLLVDEVAGLFNEVRGSIFPALTQGVYDVQFSTLSQTAKGEWRERTEFQIYERGELVPYAALSGGQRRRIDVGVMLTLVKAVSTWMQVPGVLGILILDEVFGFLDGSGAEGLMEALREMQSQIPSIFVVSHEPQLQALFPEVISVEQDKEGVSRIVSEVA